MSRRRGVTLIEMLAVVVILGAAMTLMLGVAGPLRSVHSSIQAEKAAASAVARARLIAQADGGATVSTTGGAISIESVMRTSLVHLGSGWGAALAADIPAEPIGSVRLDEAGRSSDYLIQLTDRAGVVRTLTVLGLSGQVLPRADGAER